MTTLELEEEIILDAEIVGITSQDVVDRYELGMSTATSLLWRMQREGKLRFVSGSFFSGKEM